MARVQHRPEWNGDLEPVTPLRQSGALANYAIPAYKSFPVGNVSKLTSNRQPADYETAALPLRQRSKIGAEGYRKQFFELYIGCASDSCPAIGRSSIENGYFFKWEQQVARRPGDVGSATTGVERRHRACGLPVNGRTLCQLSYEPKYF